jgi:seryl-tRNA synthetase
VLEISRLYNLSNETSRQLNLKRAERGPLGHAIKLAKDDSERALALERAQALKETIHRLEKELETIEGQLFPLAESLPNDTHPSAPIGSGSAAVIVSTHGPRPIPASPLRDHVHVGRELDLIDMESAATVTGSSWYYLKNEGALLELALTNYAMSIALKAGFTPVMTPDVVKADIARRCGFHPRDESGNGGPSQNYRLERRRPEEPELVLAGTAEIPLAGLLARRTLEEKELPIMFAGLGRAFRSEAGARGVDTRGLYRVHQFSKVELFAVTRQEESDRMMEQMAAIQQEIFGGLNIPFR